MIIIPNHCSNYCRYIARSLSQQEDETEPTEESPKSFTPRLLGVMPDSDQKVFFSLLDSDFLFANRPVVGIPNLSPNSYPCVMGRVWVKVALPIWVWVYPPTTDQWGGFEKRPPSVCDAGTPSICPFSVTCLDTRMMVCSFPAGLSPLFAAVFEFNQNEKETVSFVPYPITINFNQYIMGMGNF